MCRGIDAEALVCNSYSKTTRSIFALKQRVLGGCKFYDDGKIAVIAFRKKDFEETGTTTADTDGVIDPVIAIAGAPTRAISRRSSAAADIRARRDAG